MRAGVADVGRKGQDAAHINFRDGRFDRKDLSIAAEALDPGAIAHHP